MFLQNAAVHDNLQTRSLRSGGREHVDHALLHPDTARSNANGFVNVGGNFLAPSKYIHEIDLVGHLIQGRISLLSKDFGFVRIHGNNAVAVRLHVGRNAITGARLV